MNKKDQSQIALFFCLLLFVGIANKTTAQKNKQTKTVTRPVYIDPVYDGAADPSVIWNKVEKKWFMFYTNRRAKTDDSLGVRWVHGTRIGIAESSDGGATWKYRDTANINYRPVTEYTLGT